MRSSVVSCLKIMCVLLSNVFLLASDNHSYNHYGLIGTMTTIPGITHYDRLKKQETTQTQTQAVSTLAVECFASHHVDSSDSFVGSDDLGSPLGLSSTSMQNDSMCRLSRWCKLPQAMKSMPSATELSVLATLAGPREALVGQDPNMMIGFHGVKTPAQGRAEDHGNGSPSRPTPKKNAVRPQPICAHIVKTPLDHGNASPKKD